MRVVVAIVDDDCELDVVRARSDCDELDVRARSGCDDPGVGVRPTAGGRRCGPEFWVVVRGIGGVLAEPGREVPARDTLPDERPASVPRGTPLDCVIVRGAAGSCVDVRLVRFDAVGARPMDGFDGVGVRPGAGVDFGVGDRPYAFDGEGGVGARPGAGVDVGVGERPGGGVDVGVGERPVYAFDGVGGRSFGTPPVGARRFVDDARPVSLADGARRFVDDARPVSLADGARRFVDDARPVSPAVGIR